jgi:hypothetical protein
MLIKGRTKIKVEEYDDPTIKCEECGHYGQRFFIYQEYFHVFFIPFFPTKIKVVKCSCLKCNDTFNEEKKKYYSSITRTPIYLYTGLFLLLAFIISVVFYGIQNDKKEKEYVNNPEIGDIYLIHDQIDNSSVFYFVKIINIKSDTVEVLHGALQYDKYLSKMFATDYFVENDEIQLLKKDLKDFLASGKINRVIRNY